MATDSNSPFGPGWLFVKDAAQILGPSEKTLRRQVKRGLLEGRREGDRPNGRLWIRIPEGVLDQPTTQLAAAQIEIRDLKRELEEATTSEAEQARLRDDAEKRAEAATQGWKNANEDAKIAATRHRSERRTQEDDIERLRLDIQDWERHSAGVENARDDAEEERDRYLELYESAKDEVESLREAAQRHDSVVKALNQGNHPQSTEIRRLQDENKRLQAEPATLQAEIREQKRSIGRWQRETDHVRKIGGWLVLLTALAGALAPVFWIALYLFIRAPAGFILLAT